MSVDPETPGHPDPEFRESVVDRILTQICKDRGFPANDAYLKSEYQETATVEVRYKVRVLQCRRNRETPV
jgi:hypothetical protein